MEINLADSTLNDPSPASLGFSEPLQQSAQCLDSKQPLSIEAQHASQ